MPSERTILILWDIDHTLIESRGAGTAVYEHVFPRVTGKPFHRLAQVSGRTELDIIHDTLTVHCIDPTEEMVRRLADSLADGYRETGALSARGRILPGALAALDALSKEPHVQQGVLTGNTTDVAKIKVETFGLDRFLDLSIGAYGDDHNDRAELVVIARGRAAKRLGHPFAASDVLIIGDTPNDVDAALRSGAHVLGVASGKSTVQELKAAGAATVVEDLTDFEPLQALIDNLIASSPAAAKNV